MQNPISVNIVMVTYNQEVHIRKAIESVLMQETNYSYKLIIGDDCSNDNSYEICKEYALKYQDKITLLKNPSNIGLLENYLKCFHECTAKYIAILEGDDYWSDPLKIQKQLELLEQDENTGLVHSNYQILNEQTNEISDLNEKMFEKTLQFQGYIYSKIIRNNFICAVTVMFRRDIINQIDFNPFLANHCNTVDLIIYLQCSMQYKIAFLTDPMAIYRVSLNSLSNSNQFEKIEKFADTKYFIRKHYLNLQSVPDFDLKTLKNSKDVFLLFKALQSNDFGHSFKYLKKFSFKGLAFCIKYWKVYNQ